MLTKAYIRLNWETLSEGPPPGTVFGGGVDSSPSITRCINPVPLRCPAGAGRISPLGSRTPSLFVGSQRFHKRDNLQTWPHYLQHKGRIPTDKLSPKHPETFQTTKSLVRFPLASRRRWPHQTPSASNPHCWKDAGFSSQLTSDMWLTILSFQNSQAKPSANKAIAGPTPVSLIEIPAAKCLNIEGRLLGWLRSRTGKKV